MSGYKETVYFDAAGNQKKGYIIDGKTYTDPQGASRVDVGSKVYADDGMYVLTPSGGRKIADYSATAYSLADMAYDPIAASYINDLYGSRYEAGKSALDAAYQSNVAAMGVERAAVPEAYGQAKNATAAQTEAQKAAFNEYAAASGLNTGAGGQAALAFSSGLQRDLASLDKAQANALTELDARLSQLTTQYRSDLANAFAQGNLERIGALYQDYESNRSRLLSQRQLSAQETSRETDREIIREETAYNRAMEASAASGDYAMMAAYGWTPEMIRRAEALWRQKFGF